MTDNWLMNWIIDEIDLNNHLSHLLSVFSQIKWIVYSIGWEENKLK